jgi:triphosphoribosyl-dephospho-CoA synthetase
MGPTTPIGSTSERQYLRAAGRAVEHPVGQKTHLGVMTLLAGVVAVGFWKGGYLPKYFEDRPREEALAQRTSSS